MSWFIAKIVFSITSENTVHKPQFDEQLRLIAAEDEGEAFLKARVIGLQEEDAFINDKANRVKWEFINVSEISAVNQLADGSEVYSHIHETDEATHYIRSIHQKAIYLRNHTKQI